MKRIVCTICAFSILCCALAQGIGIGTTKPNPKAVLDISSSTQGVLLPRLSSEQRTNITSPPAGLLIYDTDLNEIYQYNGTIWRAILNNGYWRRFQSNRSRITNAIDSIGIGTNFPRERLEVDGNIKLTGNLNFSGNITNTNATGNASLTPLCFGTVDAFGDILTGTGNFTVTVNGSGSYAINCAGISANSILIATSKNIEAHVFAGTTTNGVANVVTKLFNGISTYSKFNFIIYK